MKKIVLFFLLNIVVFVGLCQEVIDQVVAIVGENPILYSEIQGQKLQLLQQGVELEEDIDCYLLDEFMTQQLLIHQAEIDSIEVTEDMVKIELDQRIQYFSAQVGGTEALEEFYGKSIEEIKEEFFEQIEDKMKAQKMQQEITSSIVVSPKEVKEFFKSIPEDSIPFINSQVKVSQLVIAPELSEEQKKNTKEKLNKIRTRILSNDISFSTAAEFYSCDPGTKSNDGNFGWVDRGDFVPEFDAVAFSIPIGEISHVFESPFGYHIIKVTEAKTKTIYKIAHIEKELFSSDQTINTIYRQAELFAAETSNENTFLETADEKGYKIREALKVQKNDKSVGSLTGARNIVFWLFNEASNNEVSEVFELNDRYAVAIQTGAQKEGTAQLKDVKNELKRKLLDDKKADLIISRLSELTGSYEEISTAYGPGGKVGVANLTLMDNNISNIGFAPEAIGLVFSLEEEEATFPFKIQNGVIMLTVTTKTPLEDLSDYEAYRSVVLNKQTATRRREDPFTYQNIYNALIESVEIIDNRHKFY